MVTVQFMPRTFADVATAASAKEPFDLADSIEAAGVYIAALSNFWFSKGAPLESVVASYNAGPSNVERGRRAGRNVPKIAETQAYVICVLAARTRFLPTVAQTKAVVSRSLLATFSSFFRMNENH